MNICIATNNKNKLQEISRILGGLGHTAVSAAALGVEHEPEETGKTFEENAFIKAFEISKLSGMPTLADDSGIAVAALGGAPGVYSARYAGTHSSDEANNQKLLKELEQVPEGKRGAEYVCALCLYMPTGAVLTAAGICCGQVGFKPAGGNGFGYDPLFYPAAHPGRSYAQLSVEEKDEISHRGAALKQLAKLLPAFLEQGGEANF